MFSSLISVLTNILNSGVSLVPIVVGIALVIAGATLTLGNHQHGKSGVLLALVGGAVMLAAPTIGTALGGAAAVAAGH